MQHLSAKDIMTPDPFTVAVDLPVKEAAKLMVEKGVGALPVLDEDRLVGMVSESDLIMQDVKVEFPTYVHLLDGVIMYPPAYSKFEEEFKKAVGATVRDVMTSDPITVSQDVSVDDLATMMFDEGVSRFPVMDGDRLVGIVSKMDIVRSIAQED
jgi:CBS domain-containing protein